LRHDDSYYNEFTLFYFFVINIISISGSLAPSAFIPIWHVVNIYFSFPLPALVILTLLGLLRFLASQHPKNKTAYRFYNVIENQTKKNKFE
jgi:hypothetical protein